MFILYKAMEPKNPGRSRVVFPKGCKTGAHGMQGFRVSEAGFRRFDCMVAGLADRGRFFFFWGGGGGVMV